MSASPISEYRTQTQVRPVVAPRRTVPAWLHIVAMIAVAVTVMSLLVRFAIHSMRGFRFDQRLMDSVTTSAGAWSSFMDVLSRVTDFSVAACLIGCVAIAVVQRRLAVAMGAIVLVAGANVTTQVLKYRVFEAVVGNNSLPSGHTTVGLSLALAFVLVAPPSWRQVVVPFAALSATFVGAGTVAGHWHRPADVAAGGMVCLGWAAVALAVVALFQSRVVVTQARRGLLLGALLGVVVAGVAFVAMGVRPSLGISDVPVATFTLTALGVMFAIVVGWVSIAMDRIVA
ncbi:phosphatase PAP2 family protein [Rudaeicoccus suwonensis]|uniref:phosphatase PAP2 family protein n=1 Tax=Rudaeicoccus suwonensis TaxID=657409 RepID=UPI00119E0D71|nr:phosphatase PAP2 family protein [Rudaeicoccus suwonensis]